MELLHLNSIHLGGLWLFRYEFWSLALYFDWISHCTYFEPDLSPRSPSPHSASLRLQGGARRVTPNYAWLLSLREEDVPIRQTDLSIILWPSWLSGELRYLRPVAAEEEMEEAVAESHSTQRLLCAPRQCRHLMRCSVLAAVLDGGRNWPLHL